MGVTREFLRKTICYLPPFPCIGSETVPETSAVLRSNPYELILRDHSSEMTSNLKKKASILVRSIIINMIGVQHCVESDETFFSFRIRCVLSEQVPEGGLSS